MKKTLTLEKLQAMGLVTTTRQPSPVGGEPGYKVLKFNAMYGQMMFSDSVWSREEIENPTVQENLFSKFLGD